MKIIVMVGEYGTSDPMFYKPEKAGRIGLTNRCNVYGDTRYTAKLGDKVLGFVTIRALGSGKREVSFQPGETFEQSGDFSFSQRHAKTGRMTIVVHSTQPELVEA